MVRMRPNEEYLSNDAVFSELKNDASFSSEKFTPPPVDHPHQLFRNTALRPLIASNQHKSDLIMIYAQAGQGKSVLAAQFLYYIQAEFSWIRIDSYDRDPVIFISTLVTALAMNFKKLENSKIYQALDNDRLDGFESNHLADMLLEALVPCLQNKYYIVLDDLHLLEGSTSSLRILEILSRKIPQGLQLVLISRTPVLSPFGNCLTLYNADLALHQGEVTELIAKKFGLTIAAETATQLHHITEGWLSGVIMLGAALPKRNGSVPPKLSNLFGGDSANQFRIFFKKNVMVYIPLHQKRIILALALLEEIPLALAQYLQLTLETKKFLNYLVKNNYFLQCSKPSAAIYRFHPLFKVVLEEFAVQELPVKARRIVLAKAGHWYSRQLQKAYALRYYMRSERYGIAEKILTPIGGQFILKNRNDAFNKIIAELSHPVARDFPWFSFNIANIYLRSDPFQSQVYLEQARLKFIQQSNHMGELLTTTTLITFHAGFDCNFKQGQKLLPRAEELYTDLWPSLSDADRIQCAYAITIGLCYFEGSFRRAAGFITPIFTAAAEKGLEEIMAEAAVGRGLIYNLEGDWTVFKKHIEETQHLLYSHRVGHVTKLMLYSQQLALLGLEGNFTVYGYYMSQMSRLVAPQLLDQTINAPLLLIADINIALAQDRFEEAMQIAQKGLALDGSGGAAHLQSLYLGYFALLAAMSGRKEKALQAAKESARLREIAGGAYHKLVSRMLLGGIYRLLNMHGLATTLLSEAIEGSVRLGEKFVRISAYANRALLRLDEGKIAPALDDIRLLLTTMRTHRFYFFHTWNSAMMERLLATAIKNDIEADFAQMLANKRLKLAITAQGKSIPLLEITTLGEMKLTLQGTTIGGFNDFTAAQRELLALLCSAPNFGLPIEMIQLNFWPDGSPAKVRSKFDNLLGRLRKILNTLVAPFPAGRYLSTEKGILRLTNCRIDAVRFYKKVQTGIDHLRSKNHWQAGNAFISAHLLYQGMFMPKVNLGEQALRFRKELRQAYLESAQSWADLLKNTQRTLEAIDICLKALEHDPTHQPLVKTCYHLLIQSHIHRKATDLIDNYKTALATEGFSPAEIESIMENFWS